MGDVQVRNLFRAYFRKILEQILVPVTEMRRDSDSG